jgi:hypothetical protein
MADAHRRVGRPAAQLDLEDVGELGSATGEAFLVVGQQVVVDHVVVAHAGHMVGQGGQQARAVLARRAMDQHRAARGGQAWK